MPSPARIVSLVPSLTEALFVLELGDRVVGVTDWCVHPAEALANVPRVGGTKDPDVETILGLEPDLVIANHEENTRRVVERLRERGANVWVTFPRTVAEGVALLRELAEVGAPDHAVRLHVESAEAALAALQRARIETPTRVFCPIWRDPWMSIGADTYAHDLVSLCGGDNVFGGRADRRYPRVTLADVESADPEVVLLPDEPYRFSTRDVEEIRGLGIAAARHNRIHLIDGTLVSWYGPRIPRALEELRALLQER